MNFNLKKLIKKIELVRSFHLYIYAILGFVVGFANFEKVVYIELSDIIHRNKIYQTSELRRNIGKTDRKSR